MHSAAHIEDCDGDDWYQDIERPIFKPHCARKERKRMAHAPPIGDLTNWPHRGRPTVTVNITIPTLLDDHSLHFVVAKPKRGHHVQSGVEIPDDASAQMFPGVRNLVFVNHIHTGLEGVARNGALYGISRVLHPFKPHSEEANEEELWKDWEEYLPAWGEQ